MIDLYTWATPNGRKISIALEEIGAPYRVHPRNVMPGNPKPPEFLAMAPNGKIPVIVDRDTGVTTSESGAILIYLADKYGKLLPADAQRRAKAVEWLFWQVSALGPMQGQAFQHVVAHPGKAPFAEAEILREVTRLYGVLDARLSNRDYLADEYSVADIACWTWVARRDWARIDLAEFANITNWYSRIGAREAVQVGYDVPHKAHDFRLTAS